MRYGERSGEGMMWILSLIVTSAQAATVNVPSTSAPTITEALEQPHVKISSHGRMQGHACLFRIVVVVRELHAEPHADSCLHAATPCALNAANRVDDDL